MESCSFEQGRSIVTLELLQYTSALKLPGTAAVRVHRLVTFGLLSSWSPAGKNGDLYRRWKARLGTPKAITAMAHKLARILWHLLKFKQPFNPQAFRHQEEKMRRKKLARLQNSAAALGYRLVESQ